MASEGGGGRMDTQHFVFPFWKLKCQKKKKINPLRRLIWVNGPIVDFLPERRKDPVVDFLFGQKPEGRKLCAGSP